MLLEHTASSPILALGFVVLDGTARKERRTGRAEEKSKGRASIELLYINIYSRLKVEV